VNRVLAASDNDEGPWLGATTAGTLFVIDLFSFACYAGGLILTPGSISTVLLACRVAIIAFGARFWLLGVCFV